MVYHSRSNAGIVSSENVVVTDTRDTSDGLEVRFYAQLRNGAGVLSRNALEQSVQVKYMHTVSFVTW